MSIVAKAELILPSLHSKLAYPCSEPDIFLKIEAFDLIATLTLAVDDYIIVLQNRHHPTHYSPAASRPCSNAPSTTSTHRLSLTVLCF